jgi:hypothetical protein
MFLTKLRAAIIISRGVFWEKRQNHQSQQHIILLVLRLSLTLRPALMDGRLRSRTWKVESDQPAVPPSASSNVVEFELPMPRSILQLRAEPPSISRFQGGLTPFSCVEFGSRQARDPTPGFFLGCLQLSARFRIASLKRHKHPSPLCVLNTAKYLLSLI